MTDNRHATVTADGHENLPRVLTYEEWLKATGTQKRVIKCEECDGEGFTDCYACGQEIDCEECGGRGEWDETKLEYEGQRERDIERWKAFQAAQPGARAHG